MSPVETATSDPPRSAANQPRNAATVVLLREHAGEIQVLMTQRHVNLRFMGGMWVFPGGALSDADRSETAMSRLPEAHTISCARLDTLEGVRLGEQDCLAMVIAACRETFEETGLLLARRIDGAICDARTIQRVQSQRTAVAGDAALFAELLVNEDLLLDASRLIYWAHWITPSSAPRRFDTRFFAIAAPGEQTATPDLGEASNLQWMSPEQLLASAASGAMPMTQPTLFNLEDLNASIRTHESLAALFSAEANRSVITIMPKMVRDGDRMKLVLPWDGSYGSTAGDGVSCQQPQAFASLPSLQMTDRTG